MIGYETDFFLRSVSWLFCQVQTAEVVKRLKNGKYSRLIEFDGRSV